MGISYATLGAALGIPVTLTIPASASPERFAILRALGAELILTDPLEGSDGAILRRGKLQNNNPMCIGMRINITIRRIGRRITRQRGLKSLPKQEELSLTSLQVLALPAH